MTRARAALSPVTGYQRALQRCGVALMAAGLLHVVPLVADGMAWDGPVSWRKPILFGVSLGLAAWSIGWVLGHLPERRGAGWSITATVGVGSVVEWVLITVQRWRGVPSHFNTATALDGAVFTAMGISIGVVSIGVLLAFLWALVELRGAGELRWAVLTGLGLLLVAAALGGDLIARGSAVVAATGTVPDAVRIGAAGPGRLAHAVGLHALQVLGAIAFLERLGPNLPGVRLRAVRRASVAYVVGFAAVAAQVYAGRALLDLSPATGVAAAAAVVVAATGLASLRAAASGSRRADESGLVVPGTQGTPPPAPTISRRAGSA